MKETDMKCQSIVSSIQNMPMYHPLKEFNFFDTFTLRMLKGQGFQCFVIYFLIIESPKKKNLNGKERALLFAKGLMLTTLAYFYIVAYQLETSLS